MFHLFTSPRQKRLQGNLSSIKLKRTCWGIMDLTTTSVSLQMKGFFFQGDVVQIYIGCYADSNLIETLFKKSCMKNAMKVLQIGCLGVATRLFVNHSWPWTKPPAQCGRTWETECPSPANGQRWAINLRFSRHVDWLHAKIASVTKLEGRRNTGTRLSWPHRWAWRYCNPVTFLMINSYHDARL